MASYPSGIVRLLLAALLVCAAISSARADSPSVTAVLNSSETAVDQPVQLQIKVSGDSSATPPTDISVDGLDIRYAGQSQLVEGRNFRFTYSFVYNYTILPLKAGTFTIPPQIVQTSGGKLRTPALTLNVSPNDDGTTTSRRGSRADGNAVDQRKIVFAELIIPKTTAYVGETIPVEIRLGFNAHVPSRFVEPATLSGQGFTSQGLQNPEQSVTAINGHPYNILTYKTAITPVKSGKIEISAKGARAIVQVPRRNDSRGRSPFDLFGMDDPFNDPSFNDPFAGVGEQREVKFSSEPTTVEVKPLPPNAPASFSGAVGHFSLTTEVKPRTAQVGDPLTVTANISGRGSFDRVTAPELENDRGWHTYPPSAKFKPDDDIGISGTKTFEMVLTPDEPKKAVPPLVFSYFDPLKEAYVTLKGEKLPVVV
ncbi:MAG: BatD family protein, partial [Terriglobia bacterium]